MQIDRRHISTLAFAVLISFFFSCSKKEGCLDPNAANFDNDVLADDGSCIYDLSFVLSTNKHFSTDVYVDEQYKGTLNYLFTGPIPGCGKDTFLGFSGGGVELIGVINTAVSPGEHSVKVVAVDGTEWEKTYTIGQNCLRIFIDDQL